MDTGKGLSRRNFLRATACGAATLLAGPLLAQPARKPNVVLIYTDDQGTADLPSYGSRDLVMPHVESLAARGVRFSQFYAPAPICSPSRAGALTGRYPLRAGVPSNVSSDRGAPGLPSRAITMAEMLKAAGYATAHIGKWHLGFDGESNPNAQGFDYSFGHMGGCIDNYSHFFYWSGPNRHDLYRNGEEVFAPGRFFPDLMIEEASRFMDAHRDGPFFLYFAANAPHYPYQGEPDWLGEYQQAGVPYPRDLYGAFLSTLDERIGQLIGKVESLGLLEDTIIIYQSDNGHSTEERAHFGGGSAGLYRGAKFSLFEGGIRVPAVVSWPGHLPEGESRAQIAHGCDWLPTIADLCGVALQDHDIDGKSLVPVIQSNGAESPHDTLIWHVGEGEKSLWAIRKGDWKLLGRPEDTSGKVRIRLEDELFLVNLAEDPSEQTNLAATKPEKRDELKGIYDAWLATVTRDP